MRYIDKEEEKSLLVQWENGCPGMKPNERAFIMEKLLRVIVKRDPSIMKELKKHMMESVALLVYSVIMLYSL